MDLLKTFLFILIESVLQVLLHYTQIFFKENIILDLSSSHNNVDHLSINELIDNDLCSLSYIKLDDAIRIIHEFGPNSMCCKLDISDEFKHLPISPKQQHRFCFKWDNLYYNFVRLPFGCRSSPRLFDMLSRSICWIVKSDYNISVIFYLLGAF